ncbi:hypothetical protein B7494_g5841 [Chlorociboria aeruginascens]|nr:hypothetical protein B7494_g5841 [Chlorociboria aeruginascens]
MENSRPFPTLKRASSLPVPRPTSSPAAQLEVLFTLPSARIVSFTTDAKAKPRSSNYGHVVEEEPGTLPWTSRFERTTAVGNYCSNTLSVGPESDISTIGPLRIYRAPGSVAFLNCSNALKPILPKSRCWCVDEESSKFIVAMKVPQYWRIEIPVKTPKEKDEAQELRRVLSQVLLFEKTPCPFQRTFTVDLPEIPSTPIIKRPWKPVGKPKSTAVLDNENIASHTLVEENRTTTVHTPPSHFSEPSLSTILPTEEIPVTSSPISRSPVNVNIREAVTSWDEQLCIDNTDITPTTLFNPRFDPEQFESENANRLQTLQSCSNRSTTAPPILTLVTSPPSKRRTRSPLKVPAINESDSDFSSSVDSFHSVLSWHSPLDPPSPTASESSSPTTTYPYPHDDIILPKRAHHKRDNSERTITPETPHMWDMTSSPDTDSIQPPKTPTLLTDNSEKSDEEEDEVVTPPTIRTGLRHRATTSSNSRRRTLSPLPPAANIFSPRRRARRLQTARHLPTAIIQKTCEILFSPPSHLLNAMISIASKIAAGEWRGFLNGYGEAVHWDFTEDEYTGEGWAEDDYGISVHCPQPKSRKSSQGSGSWEVD